MIVFVEEATTSPTNGSANGPNLADATSALSELIARIQSKPSDPANIKPGNMRLLAERLAHPVSEPDPSFDPAAWNQQWSQLEAEMDAIEEAEEQSRLRDLVQ